MGIPKELIFIEKYPKGVEAVFLRDQLSRQGVQSYVFTDFGREITDQLWIGPEESASLYVNRQEDYDKAMKIAEKHARSKKISAFWSVFVSVISLYAMGSYMVYLFAMETATNKAFFRFLSKFNFPAEKALIFLLPAIFYGVFEFIIRVLIKKSAWVRAKTGSNPKRIRIYFLFIILFIALSAGLVSPEDFKFLVN